MIKNRRLSEQAELKILHRAIKMLPKECRHTAIDGGANIGNWSSIMAKYFYCVLAFEPVSYSYRTFVENTHGFANVIPYNHALMDEECVVAMVSPRNRSSSTAMHAHMATEENLDIERVRGITIDSLSLPYCDLIKLDLEGAEMRALLGAEQTIKRHRPLLIIEIVPKQLRRYKNTAQQIDQFLTKLGYTHVLEQRPNVVYKWLNTEQLRRAAPHV